MSSEKISTDRIIGLSAMMISLLTLIIFIYQTALMRTQSRLSVKPLLSFETNMNFKDTVAIYTSKVKNKGLGPAIIESIDIVLEDQRYPLNFRNFFKKAYPGLENYTDLELSTTLEKGSTLISNEEVDMYRCVYQLKSVPEIMEILKITQADEIPFDIEVVYSSIYEDTWKTSAKADGHPVEL